VQLNVSTAIFTDVSLYSEDINGGFDVLHLPHALQIVRDTLDGLFLFYARLRIDEPSFDGSTCSVHADAPHPE